MKHIASGYAPTERQKRALRSARVLTTGQAALACRVTTNSVKKWCKAGQLAFYTLPCSNARRIMRDELVRFMKEHSVPTDLLGEKSGPACVLAGAGEPWFRRFQGVLPPGWTLHRSACLFSAALAVADLRPEAVILDGTLGASACACAAKSLAIARPGTLVIGVLWGDADGGMYDLAVGASDDPAKVAEWLLGKVS
jgi:hypothetical protein